MSETGDGGAAFAAGKAVLSRNGTKWNWHASCWLRGMTRVAPVSAISTRRDIATFKPARPRPRPVRAERDPEILEAVLLPRRPAPVQRQDPAATFMCGMALGALSALVGVSLVLASF